MEDNTPIDEALFELQVMLADKFPALSPLTLRKEKAQDVFRLFSKYRRYLRKSKKTNNKKVIRKPAGDNWF